MAGIIQKGTATVEELAAKMQDLSVDIAVMTQI